MTPENPIDVVQRINPPILGLYGGADPGIPISQIDAMSAALKHARKPSEIVVYPHTPHGFNADYRPSYRPQQARDGWWRMLAWLKQHGVA
jgi:carboxymethylenebutenolidase